MATVRTTVAGGGSGGTGNRSVSLTTVVGDIIVVFCVVSVNTNAAPTCSDNSADAPTYTLLGTALKNASADIMSAFITTTRAATAAARTITVATGSNTAGEVVAYAIQGLSKLGASAVLQTALAPNLAAGGTPAATFGAAAKFGNVVIGAVGGGTAAPAVTQPSGFTENQDASQINPTTGLEAASVNLGQTPTTLTWGSTIATAHCVIALELNASHTPAAGSLSIASDAQSATTNTLLTPATGTLTITGATPTIEILLITNITPAAGTLSMVSDAPSAPQNTIRAPPAGSLSLTGSPAYIPIPPGSIPKFYLRSTLSDVDLSLTGEQSTVLPVGTLTGSPTADNRRRQLLKQIGAGGVGTFLPNLNVAHEDGWQGRYVSDPLDAGTIPTQTWRIAVNAFLDTGLATAWLVLSMYVWRPSTASVVGSIYDSDTTLGAGFAINTTTGGRIATFSGASVATVQIGDRLVLETWAHATSPGVGEIDVFYNGAVDVVEGGSNTGSFLEVATGADVSITPATGTLTAAGQTPTRSIETFLTPAAGTLIVNGVAPTAPAATLLTPAAGTLSLVGQTPALVFGTAPAAGEISLVGQTPELKLERFITPAVGALSVVGQQAAIGGDANLTPLVGALSIVGQTPVVVRETFLTPATGTLSLVGQTPAALRETRVTPGAGSLSLIGQTPVISAGGGGGVSIAPATGTLSLVGQIPTVVKVIVSPVRLITLTMGSPAPSITLTMGSPVPSIQLIMNDRS